MLDHASGDVQLPVSERLVSLSSGTAIMAVMRARHSGDWEGPSTRTAPGRFFQSTVLRSPEGWCFELERRCQEP